MKIILTSRKKETFEIDVDPSTTILDLKKIFINKFGLPEEAAKSIKIIIKQVIQRDDEKTLMNLNVTEGTSINFYLPNSLKQLQTPSSLPNEETHQEIKPPVSENAQRQDDQKLPEPQNKPEKEPYFQSQNIQQPTQQSYPPPQNKPEKEPYFQSQNIQQPTQQSYPPPQNKPETDQHLPSQNAQYQTNSFNQNATQESFGSSFMKLLKQSKYPEADPQKLQQLLEMGYDERHARVFLRGALNNYDFAFENMSNTFYQNEHNFDRYEAMINGTLSTEEIERFNNDLFDDHRSKNKDHRAADFFQNLFQLRKRNINSSFGSQFSSIPNSINPQFGTIPNSTNPQFGTIPQYGSTQNPLLQLQQMVQQRQQQRAFASEFTKGLAQVQILTASIQKINEISTQSPDQFVNPYIEYKNLLISTNMANDDFYRAIEKAANFNRDQILFIGEFAKVCDFNTIVSVLDATNGNIEEARAILNSGSF